MQDKINQYLQEIEQEKNIKILLACETGSRAWGFPSPDSDYDVRMIYRHPRDWYLSITEKKDTIERMLEDNNIDITGWDLRKTLRLLWKSNPPLLERIQSPILYQYDAEFLKGITALATQTYSKIATMHHYLNMARKSYAEVSQDSTFKLKKFFYALRTATACYWILEREEIPPIEFKKMMNGLPINRNITNRIEELIALKQTQDESYLHHEESELTRFIENCLAVAEEKAPTLPAANAAMEDLNAFFRATLTD